jgi:hypothetical protein
MKSWFPFSDYDFYSFLTSGILMLFAIDYWLSGGNWVVDKGWTVQQNVLVLIIAYITGQIIAIPSSIIYDFILVDHILGHPMEVQLGDGEVSFVAKVLKIVIGQDYGRLPESIKKNVLKRAKADTDLKDNALLNDKKNIFDIAFIAARGRVEDKVRIDDYRNQYGFGRNVSLTSFITAIFMYYSNDVNAKALAILFCFLGFGMMLRFLTFYTSFSAEVLRSYAFEAKTTTLEVVANSATTTNLATVASEQVKQQEHQKS